ncbi:hypothetical protein [Flavobacterium covae]|uniref:hypothetical protein n=1 Tax=Flavobacterium covae TaxID=2906076 RepID=UPI00119F1F34|nr:hypothetical protein [Flavobacterium covae]MCJ1808961.1 hypothetical protein [Flavobacterium covae]
MKAIVTATIEQLLSIGIPFDAIGNNDFRPGVEVTIVNNNIYKHPQFGAIAEVEYLYKNLNYQIPTKWLKLKNNDNN